MMKQDFHSTRSILSWLSRPFGTNQLLDLDPTLKLKGWAILKHPSGMNNQRAGIVVSDFQCSFGLPDNEGRFPR